MKYLKLFESFYDNEVLKFLYELDELSKELDEKSYEGWSMWVNYEFDENKDYILVEMSAYGYSEGFSRDMKIYYKEHMVGPVRVEESSSDSTVYGDSESSLTTEYDCYEDIIEEIKSFF